MARLLLLGDNLGDRNQNLDGEQPHTILVILYQVLEHGYHLVHHNRGRHLPHELGHVGSGLSAHHGGIIVHELVKLPAKLLLGVWRDLGVGRGKESASGDLGGEPVGLRETQCEWDEVFLDLL